MKSCGRDYASKSLTITFQEYQVIKDTTSPQPSLTPNELKREGDEWKKKPAGFPGLFSLTFLKGVCTEKYFFILDILSIIILSITFPTATDKKIFPIISECCILSYATEKIMINIFILGTLGFNRD